MEYFFGFLLMVIIGAFCKEKPKPRKKIVRGLEVEHDPNDVMRDHWRHFGRSGK